MDEGSKLQRSSQSNGPTETITGQVFYREITALISSALKQLTLSEQKLLKLYYNDCLIGKEIGEFCGRTKLPLEIDGVGVDSQNVYYLLGKLSQRLIAAVDLEIDGKKITDKQWEKVLMC